MNRIHVRKTLHIMQSTDRVYHTLFDPKGSNISTDMLESNKPKIPIYFLCSKLVIEETPL